MPPKPPPGKKGADEVDLSDLASLPPLNFISFAVLYHKFYSQATREKLQKYVSEHFPAERVKILSRDEIITYGKGKQFILEPGQAATLPQDDPRAKMSEADQIAKSAVEKIFEMQVVARRTKKERLQKIEDEAKAAQQPLQIDHDLLDSIFHLVDFPQTKEEAQAFAKLNHTLNCVFVVNQTFRAVTPDDDDELVEALQGQESPLAPDQDGADKPNEDKTRGRLDQLLAARNASAKTSALRGSAVIKLDYVNWPVTEYKVNDQGEEIEVKKEAEVAFSDDLNAKLEHYGALSIKYQRFREKVQLIPLAPDQNAIRTLTELQEQTEEYKQWLSSVENMIASLDQQSAQDPTLSEQIQSQKKEVEEERVTKAAEDDERKKAIHDCKEKLKESNDDKYYMENYSLEQYKTSFHNHKEGQNSIQAIMSAMVSQIAVENSYEDVYREHVKQSQLEHEKSASTAEETIDDLFESFNASVNYDLQVWNRPSYSDDSENNEVSIAMGQSIKQRKQGAQPFSVQQTAAGDVFEYNNDHDSLKKSLQKLNRVSSSADENRAESICDRTKSLIDNLVLPGISSRHLMPPVPSKSERLRDMERAGLYPFATLPIDEVERGLIMKAFQELIRSNQIDEGIQGDSQRHSKYKVFERNYEEHMTPEILRQVLAEALLQEPDVASLYYPRDDSLLLALYNKVKLEKAKRGLDGERQWRAAYRVLPDFENWVKYFADDIVVEAAGFQKIDGQPVKYQMDEEMIPESLLDIDDQKVSNIQEQSEMFFPLDGSVMKVDKCSAGGLEFRKSIILKDNLAFGLRKATDKPYEQAVKPVEEHGLVSYKKVGDVDFWLRFENDTKVLIEAVQKKRNPQKLIRIDPPKPTPEEIAAREEAIKQAQLAAAKNKGKPGAPGAPPVIEEYKEPEPTWEPEPFDFLDGLFQDEELERAFYNQVTTTLPNGLIVQHLSDGNIIQMTQDQLLQGESDEKDRVFIFSSNGVVVRHFRNRDAEVLYPSGVRAFFTKKDMTWVVTNNKGLRTAKKAGISWDLEPIPCAFETDAVTNARMMTREDKVMTIEFNDGSLFCQHGDGTLMKTSADRSEVRIEKEGFAPVLFKRGAELADGTVSFPDRASLDTKDARLTPDQRSFDQVIVETHLPDGTVVDTYLDCGLVDEEVGIQHIFKRPDFSILSVNQLNKIKVISSNARSSLNEAYSKCQMGTDFAYLQAINADPEDASKGVYTAYINPENESSLIYTLDHDQNLRYTLTAKLALYKDLIDQNSFVEASAPANGLGPANNDQIENINGPKNPFTKNYNLPRLFVIKNDGTGYELLAKEQLDHYFRVMKYSPDSIKQRKDVLVGTTQAKAHYFLTKVRTLADRETENTHLQSLDFPSNALYALLHLKQQSGSGEKENTKNAGGDLQSGAMQLQPDQFTFRQILEYQPFEALKQQAFLDDAERYKKWKLSQLRYDTEFGIVHLPGKDGQLDTKKIEEDEQVSRKIISKILRERKNKRPAFNAAQQQLDFLMGLTRDEEVSEYQRRMISGLMLSDGAGSGQGGDTSRTNPKGSGTVRSNNPVKLEQSDQEIKQLKKKQRDHIEGQLQQIRRMINTPVFVNSYYQTKGGKVFAEENPAKVPSQEMLMRMSQRIDRSQTNHNQSTNDKAQASQFHEGNSTKSHRDQHNSSHLGHTGVNDGGKGDDDKESPIVALEPEEPGLKQGSAFLRGTSKKITQANGTVLSQGQVAPSFYLQEKQYLKNKEQESLLKAEEYHVVKTKDFNVAGRLREEKPVVKVMQKSTAQSELNEKFITTECIADRRVKISSMAPRQYMNAPSVEDVRKQGQHQMILSAINKKQTFAELINQANAMVTSVLHDPLKRAFNVMPANLKFGILKVDQSYELLITLKNEDSIAQRVMLKPLSDNRITASLVEMGPIAPGMIRKVAVTIYSSKVGLIKDTLQIVTKSDIFKIPIEATIVSAENYDREVQDAAAIHGKSVTNSRVREKLNQSIQKGRQNTIPEKKKSTLKPLRDLDGMDGEDGLEGSPNDQNEDMDDMEGGGEKKWVDTTNSESRLPKLPQADKRPFDVDPKKNLKEVLKK